MKDEKVAIPPLARPQVFIAYLGEEAKDEAMKLAASLRRAGIGVIKAIGSRSLKAQLRQANSLGVRRAVIIGDEEVKAGTVILRDMTTASQETVTLDRLKDLLK